VPSVRTTGPHASDTSRLIPLVRRVRRRRGTDAPAIIRADGAYTSRMNAQFIHDRGAIPYLRPRKDAIGGSRGYPAWRTMMLRYNSERGAWLKEYHKRWIVESVFSAVKRRLDPCLFSVRRDLQRRELVMKFLVHNLILIARRERR